MMLDPTPPSSAASRRTIGTYDRYSDAQATVDRLADEDFPVERVTIVGTGLRYVEQVTGRMTVARAAGVGVSQGVFVGVLFALLFGIFFTGPAFLGLLVYGVVLGGLIGAAFGALAHGAQGGRRDFSSVAGTRADRFEVQVDAEHAAAAEQVLRGSDPAHVPAAAAV